MWLNAPPPLRPPPDKYMGRRGSSSNTLAASETCKQNLLSSPGRVVISLAGRVLSKEPNPGCVTYLTVWGRGRGVYPKRGSEKELQEASGDSRRRAKAKMYHAYYSSLSQIIPSEAPQDVSVTGSLLLAGSEVSK